MRHSVSAPPTTTASHTPARISARASSMARSALAHAVDTTDTGPASPSTACTYMPTEAISCVPRKSNPAGNAPAASRSR